jgi:hypothetical protein
MTMLRQRKSQGSFAVWNCRVSAYSREQVHLVIGDFHKCCTQENGPCDSHSQSTDIDSGI